MVEALTTKRACEQAIATIAFLLVGFHYAAFLGSWYWRYSWLDAPVHAFAGLWVGMIGLYLFTGMGLARPATWAAETLLVWGFAALAGVWWEFIEFAADFLARDAAHVLQAGVGDTMHDLFLDMLGATIIVAFRGAAAAHGLWQNRLL